MSEDTRSFTITTPNKPLIGDLSKQAIGVGVQEVAAEAAERIKKQRQAIHERIHVESAQDAIAAAEETGSGIDPAKLVSEAIDSLEVQLPNGKVVEYGPRRGASNAIKLAQLVGPQINPLLTMTITTLLNVRTIDGDPAPTMNNLIDVQKVANVIGDDGLDLLSTVHVEYFPGINRDALPILKKNLR